MAWAGPRRASSPGRCRIIKADVVGSGGHVRVIVAGDDGRSLKAVAFRHAETELGQALLSAPATASSGWPAAPRSTTGAPAPPPNFT
jgi:single-stranded-DNA-specific exonuclease